MKILDCTLRDGGYCNQWNFGFLNIRKMIDCLCEAGIDIIECGFLTDKVEYKKGITQFNNLNDIKSILSNRKCSAELVLMINYGEYDLLKLPDCDGDINGIRLAFHKTDLDYALEWAKIISNRGYKLYLQPMVSLNYTDEDFLELINRSNHLKPHAFYIVDSFGVMKQKDLLRFFYLVEHNLHKGTAIGFHSHNNMQLAYSNAQVLLATMSRHEMIIDSSVFGMGRGAGNLNTELFVEYVNENYGLNYSLKPILTVIDEILNSFYQRKSWGYSLSNYLSAKHNTHPNYAEFLEAKKTLTMDNIDDIFELMDDEKRVAYDKEYIEKLYVEYLASGELEELDKSKLDIIVQGKPILIICPGQSSKKEKTKIITEINKGTTAISVNFYYMEAETTFIFLSNIRRYRDFPKEYVNRCIVTSNIPINGAFLKVDFKRLLNDNKIVMDNSALMLIKLLIDLKCKEILLAGLDGYEYDSSKNFMTNGLRTEMSKEWVDNENQGISEVLRNYNKLVPIKFLTSPKNIKL